MSGTKVTILMPVYNTAAYLKEAVESVLAQEYNNFELLIIDDGSTDDSIDIVKSISDERIQIIHQEHLGIVAALNRGIEESHTDLIARFDADDICLPGRLSKQVAFLENNPDYVACGGEAEYIDSEGEHLFNFYCAGYSNESLLERLEKECPFIHSAVMYRKEAVLKSGGYSPAAHNFEDYLLWVKMSKIGRFCNLREQLIKVRFNPTSVTIDEKWRGSAFNNLKRKIIRCGSITTAEGERLKEILDKQDHRKIKEGAYYALCGKKFLFNNYQPRKARKHLVKAISLRPLRIDNYGLYMMSFLPASCIRWTYKKIKS